MRDYRSLSEWLRLAEYAILDGAQSEEIAAQCQSLPEGLWSLLWEVAVEEPRLLEVAPYLVRLLPDSPFTEWLLREGWGKHWGIFFALRAPVSLEELKRHFQQFLLAQVEGEPEKHYYFRFYDPRVFRTFMSVCTPEQAQPFFEPVRHFVVEGRQPEEIYLYRLLRGQVQREIIKGSFKDWAST